jgi:hypothetical protein
MKLRFEPPSEDGKFLKAGSRFSLHRFHPVVFCHDAMQYWRPKRKLVRYGYAKRKL